MNYIFNSREDANCILDGLSYFIKEYKRVSVDILKALLMEIPNSEDKEIGWTDISGIRINRRILKDKNTSMILYEMSFPEPIRIEPLGIDNVAKDS